MHWTLGIPTHGQDYNIKVDLKQVGWQIDDMIYVAEGSFCARPFGFHSRWDVL
jgi:hypothetical protein